MSKNTFKALFPLAAIFLLTLAGAAWAGESTNASRGLTLAGGPLALHGYDPVAYFEDGAPRRGVARFSAKHEGAVYRFASRENLETFEREPAKYAPQFGGFCAYGVSVGKKFDGDPEVFAIVGGKLYLNLNPEIQATWEKDVEGNVAKAEERWRKIRDQPAGSL